MASELVGRGARSRARMGMMTATVHRTIQSASSEELYISRPVWVHALVMVAAFELSG